MNILSSVGNFLLSEWLWSITFDWYHIPVSLFLCGIWFYRALRIPLISSFLLALFSYLYALCIFAFFIVVVLLYIFNFSYSATWAPNKVSHVSLDQIAQQHKLPESTVHRVFATFTERDQRLITKTFIEKADNKRSCVIQ